MSWATILQIASAILALAIALLKGWYYYKGKRAAKREALLKAAEQLAKLPEQDQRREDLHVKQEREINDAGLDAAKHSKLLSSWFNPNKPSS